MTVDLKTPLESIYDKQDRSELMGTYIRKEAV